MVGVFEVVFAFYDDREDAPSHCVSAFFHVRGPMRCLDQEVDSIQNSIYIIGGHQSLCNCSEYFHEDVGVMIVVGMVVVDMTALSRWDGD